MGPENRFGQQFFHHPLPNKNGTYDQTNHGKPVDCGRDTGDECNSHKPQARQHADECTNTHTLRSKL